MRKLLLALAICFLFSSEFILADENIDSLISRFPTVISTYSNFSKSSTNKKIIWSRTEMTEIFSVNQMTCKDNLLQIKNNPVVFLAPEKSGAEHADYYNRVGKFPLVVYKFEFDIDAEGNYLLTLPIDMGSYGYLNNDLVMIISNGIISQKGSGKQWTHLPKGKNVLYFATRPNLSNQLKITAESDIETVKNEIVKKITSNSKEDITWTTTNFIPYLVSMKLGTAPYVIAEIARINKTRPFTKNDETTALLRSFITDNNLTCYEIEKYIYLNFPDLYFYFSKNTTDPKNIIFTSFITTNNAPRTIFYQQLINDGQKTLAEKYFNQCLALINNTAEYAAKEAFSAAFYSQRFVSFFRIGQIRDANDVVKITQEKCKAFPIPNYLEGRPEAEDFVTLTQSFDETSAFQIKESLESYDGSTDQLASYYKIFLGLTNDLVKRNDGAVSINYLFHVTKNANEKLKKEFEKYCLEKMQNKLDKAKESRDIKLSEEIIEQYEAITPLPEIRLILMEEYFNTGAYSKALSQAHLIFDKYPQLQSKIIAKMVALENISELTIDQRKKIPASLLKADTKLVGQKTTVEKLLTAADQTDKKGSMGKLLKSIPLEPTHSQNWNHPQIPGYQPIEPLITKNNIVFNGSSYLLNYSIKSNEINWQYHSRGEYKKDSENGPHQKRFITEHSGNQLIMFTNRDYSGQKTVKCFDLKGDLLWDMTDQSISMIEEPICTPIVSQGKLFGLSYSNRETINVISYSVYSASTGKLISRTPISYLPTSYRDETCRSRGLSWNTYTHDNHFTQDEEFVYGYSGSGIIFKADSNSGFLLWEKGFQKMSITSEEYYYFNTFGQAPSGYIQTFGNTLLCFMPDIQMFTGLNKVTGEHVWKSMNYRPRYIHGRDKLEALYFSSASFGYEPILYKINPQNGQIIWQTTTNGVGISGEGDLVGDKLYIPSEKAMLEFDANTGKMLNTIPLNIRPLKIRCSDDVSVILSAKSAYILQNDGAFNPALIKEVGPKLTVAKVVEPDAPPANTLSYENLNLETTLKIPETTYTSPDPWKKTKLVKTSKPFHFILKVKDNLTLFREGYFQKSGLYIPPEVIWFGLYPCYDIYEDTLYLSENGKITASNLFTRETLWTYEYEQLTPVVRNSWNKVSPVIAVTNQYIAYQTENQTIRILDRNTRSLVLEFYSPSIGMIRMDGNYIVTSNGSGPVRCYDISQNAKEIWSQSYDHFGDLYTENGLLVFVRTNNSTIGFYDLKTGALKVQATSTFGGEYYIMNRWRLEENILCAYRGLYDAKTGKPLEKYQAGWPVVGGGFVGFFKRYGQDGNYIDNGKEYTFKTRGGHSDDNYLFTAIRRGNRITFFSFYYVETFELVNDKLVSIDYTSVSTGRYGSHGDQVNMDLFALDSSFLEIRRDDMYFFRNFDPEFQYEKINSFRVDNKRKFHWPYSELYPETEVTEKNWISYYGQKPKQKLSYHAFGDESFAYLRLHLSPNANRDFTYTLYMSADGIAGKISIIWDIDNWKNAQCSFNVNENTESWKETDIQGNTYLYIKMKLTGAFPNRFKNTLPNFNIEMRQMTGSQNDGSYRFGGAYNGVSNQLPWLNYNNDEAQSLKDFALRTALYENKVNFYPQGSDLITWLVDRRKLKGIDSNIMMLNKMIESNVKSYCVVNILSALLLEEIESLKSKQPNLSEFSDEFIPKVQEIVTKLNQLAITKGVSKEWADFALSFWTIEVFPYKFSYTANRDTYTKPYYGLNINAGNRVAMQYNVLSPNINQPFVEKIVPGLMPHFPQFQDLNSISINGYGAQKTGLGRMIFYSPNGSKEFCNRKGKFSEATFKIMKEGTAPITPKENFYYYNGQKFDCYTADFTFPIINISISVPNIKSPAILKSTGQTAESIMYALENLPTDNNNGLMLIDSYITMSGKSDETELKKVYGKWLNSLRDNSNSCYNALRSIFDRNQGRKDVFDFIGNIIKESKLPLLAPRKFYLDRRNIIFNKEARSALGPVLKDLVSRPENSFTPTEEYKTIDSTHKFGDALEAKKGGTIYIASKITVEDNEKVFLFARAVNNYATSHTSSIFSIWLNGKPVVEKVAYQNYDDYTFYQKVTLSKGENIILLKITGIDNYDWGNNYTFCVGDVYGAPIKGVELKPVHK